MISKSPLWMLIITLLSATALEADETSKLTPSTIELKATSCGDGWKRWDGIGNVEGMVSYRERISRLAALGNEVWIGTSVGRLLSRQDSQWTLQGTLKGIQITGIAFEGPEKIWLSTSDGIRRLDQKDGQTWVVSEFQHYYEGHPSFVSGGYIPGEDAVRQWGYVDDIYIPHQDTVYSPYVVSTEHGLFSWGSQGNVWHHFMPHDWGANSAWLDIRDLLPHRRPTCMVEDHDGNLWIGTQWDGIVRLNAQARKFHARNPDNNKEDVAAFSHIGAAEVGTPFETVADLAVATNHGILAVLNSADDKSRLARFDGQKWETHALDTPAWSVAEIDPGIVLVGLSGARSGENGMRKVRWDNKSVERVAGLDGVIREIIKLPNGNVVAASWWALYELDATGGNDSP